MPLPAAAPGASRPAAIPRSMTALVVGAAAVFAAYAACFLYFFVDDEAIPLVYARNLLRGRGFTYSTAEGRVEGYSDFLNVIWNAGLLVITRVMHLSKLSVIDFGSAISFICGVGIILLAGRAMYRSGASVAGAAGGLAFLALAGPLAMWSCSSLETVPFALIVTALASVVLLGASPPRAGAAVVLAVVAVLLRIDGFVYAGAVFAAALAVAGSPRRRWLALHVIAPAFGIALLYHAGRYAYFGSVLSTPFEAKVLYKLSSPAHAIVKTPGESYLRGFVDLYGLAIVPALVVAGVAAWRSGAARAAIVAVVLTGTYVTIVGDWMFGWRFVVPLLPLIALVIACAITRLRGWRAWPALILVVVWSAVGARAFAREYVSTEGRPIWWTAMHLGERVWLAPYGDLMTIARRAVTRGETIAYNQAGLLPFVLDVENVDDLGICSNFEARLPTTDVYFTEVGRYSPLTPAPVFNAAHAYLLYRDVRVLISRTDLLTGANDGRVPTELMGGYFRLTAVDASGENALYTRTDKDASAYRRDPSLFRQNLAHTSRVTRLDVDGTRLPDDQIGPRLRFLRWLPGTLPVQRDSRLDIRFAEHDEDVYSLYAAALSAHPPVALTVNLYNEAGQLVASEDAQPDPSPAEFLRVFDPPVRARLLSIEARAPGAARLTITDLRVDGQSAALRQYVTRMLPFPAR